MSVLPVPDVEASRRLGRGAVAANARCRGRISACCGLESNFYRSVARQSLEELPGAAVEVFCRCRKAVALERYRARAGSRHAGHFDGDRDVDELWNDEVAEPVAAGWPLLEVNTAQPVDVAAVVAFVRHAPSLASMTAGPSTSSSPVVSARSLDVERWAPGPHRAGEPASLGLADQEEPPGGTCYPDTGDEQAGDERVAA